MKFKVLNGKLSRLSLSHSFSSLSPSCSLSLSLSFCKKRVRWVRLSECVEVAPNVEWWFGPLELLTTQQGTHRSSGEKYDANVDM